MDSEAGWTIANPGFSCYLSKFTRTDEAKTAAFCKYFYLAVFSDPWLEMMKAAPADMANGSHLKFLQLCTQMLDKIAEAQLDEHAMDIDSSDSSGMAGAFMRPISKALLGLLSLMEPEPFFRGAAPLNVDFLQVKDKTEAHEVLSDCALVHSAISKPFMKIVAKYWAAPLRKYSQVMGAEATKGIEFQDLLATAMRIHEHSETVARVQLLADAVQDDEEASPDGEENRTPRFCGIRWSA